MERRILKERYWLQELLGEGGMGRVFRAVDTRTGRVVAVKLLTDSARTSPRLMRSLAQEVRAVARMQHANIVQVVDYGQSDDDANPFFVMEYVPGQSLEKWRERISVRDLQGLADGILAALACAHARGVIHRDLKPENVIVIETDDGSLRPKLVDFGVAQLGGLRPPDGTTSQAVPLSSAIVGTPAYMSPEQAQGLNRLVGPHSDLYALGVMLYELISGDLPFAAESAMQLLMAHVYREPRPLEPPPGMRLPPGLEDVIATLLAKDIAARPQFAADVRRWLRQLDWSVATDTPSEALFHSRSASATAAPTLDAAFALAPHTTGAALITASGGTTDTDDQPAADTSLLRTLLERTFDDDGDTPGAPQRDGELALTPGLFGIREVPFVGRTAEREALWNIVEKTLAEASVHVAVIGGELGVGKSRLARWLAERVEEEGLMQTLGLGLGPGSALPTDGLRGLVERHLRMRGVPNSECPAILEAALVRSGDFDLQEVTALLGWLRPVTTPQALAAAPPIDAIAVAARILRHATRRRPVLLLLDDLAGSEAELAVDLIELLLATRRLAPLPVLVVITADEVADADGNPRLAVDPSVAARLAELREREGMTWSRLERLELDEARRLATALLPVSPRLADAVAHRSGGNPQFAIEILSHWVESGQLVESEHGQLGLDGSMRIQSLPGELVELMRSRLGTLLAAQPDPVRARALLGRAALCGRRFSLTILEALLEREGRDDLAAHVDPLLERLLEEHFWVEIEAGVLQFARAELHAQLLEHLVPRNEAMVIHGHLAELKRAHYGDHLAAVGQTLEIAEHELSAGLYDGAAESLLRAGHQALGWARYGTAREAFTRVEALLAERSLTDAARLADTLDLGLALCGLRTGDYAEAERRVDRVEQRLRASSRQAALATAALLRAELTFKRGHADDAANRFAAARSRFEAIGEREGVARSLQGLADVSRVRGDYEAGRTAAIEARAIHEALGNRQDAARCLLIEGMIGLLCNQSDDARQRYESARRAFEEAGDLQGVLEARSALSALLVRTGHHLEALKGYEELVERFAELGDRANVAHCYRALGQLNLTLGRPESSEQMMRRALELAESLGDKLGMARALNGLGELARNSGAWEAALDYYRRYVEAASALGAPLSVAIGHANIGLTAMQFASWADARLALLEAARIARQIPSPEFLSAFLSLVAVCSARLGDWADASEAMLESLELDRATRGRQSDFLHALERFFEVAHDVLPELAGQALEVARDRWQHLGNEAAVARIDRLRLSPRKG